ncbi:Rieske 2Fe-2S domain-containing protein [Streptomyces sp. NPDC059003]|uniref:Rieske 2Fe-2S domain-containing protein n=1 Tax=Streptomyces sp. NPDC059003 TaxID=3346691 RepID=UPI0036BDB22F
MPDTTEKASGYPTGWFPVAFTAEVERGQVARSALAGEDVVIYRTTNGILRVIRPYCPHLGAHLGYGGRVEGEFLVCPFHGFAFDPNGTCARTGYGTLPPRAQLTVLPSGEANGLVYAWYSPAGDLPAWEFASVPAEGFGKPVDWMTTGPGHPMDFIENTVDFGHFPSEHGTRVVTESGKYPHPEYGDFQMLVTIPLQGFQFSKIGVTVKITCDGLGHAIGEFDVPQVRLRVRENLGWTPVGPGRIAFRKSSFTMFDLRVGKRHPARLAAAAITPIVSRVMSAGAVRQGNKDVIIWGHRRFVEHPKLARGDGPIMEYRRWAARFFAPDDLAVLADRSAAAPLNADARKPSLHGHEE